MIRRVIIDVDRARRVVVYPEGGFELECYIDGPGWCIDTDAEVSDYICWTHLQAGLETLAKVERQMKEVMGKFEDCEQEAQMNDYCQDEGD